MNESESYVTPGIGYLYYNAMKKYAQNVAQVDGHTGEEETYESLLKRSIRVAIAMQEKGIKAGDFVSMCTVNDFDACVVYIASLFIGAITANVTILMESQEILDLLRRVSPKLVFVAKKRESAMEEVVSELGGQVVVFGDSQRYTSFQEFLNPSKYEEEFKPRIVEDLNETVFVAFSSGTTSRPKGVCHNHKAMISDKGSNYFKTFAVFYSPYLSLFNTYIHKTILHGFKRIVFNYFNFEDPWIILNYVVDYTLLSPSMSEAFLKIEKPEHLNIANLKWLSIGGNYSSKEYIKKLRAILPMTTITQSYGQTESFLQITNFPPNTRGITLGEKYPDSVGILDQEFTFKVVNVNTEEVLGPNQEGELRLKTKTLMKGYHNDNSRKFLDADGWLKTGDLVYYNEDKCFFVIGRISECFKYRYNHIYPQEIEDVLLTHRSIERAVVLGLPHDTDGNHPMAIVQINTKEPSVTPEEIVRYVEERVYDKNKLRGGVKFIEKFPMTPSLKIKRSQLKEMVKNRLI